MDFDIKFIHRVYFYYNLFSFRIFTLSVIGWVKSRVNITQ